MTEEYEKAKQFCSEEGVCYLCFSVDPEVLRYLEAGQCSYCVDVEVEVEAQAQDIYNETASQHAAEEAAEIEFEEPSDSLRVDMSGYLSHCDAELEKMYLDEQAERRKNCYGCQQHLLNQLGNMQEGGCLSVESDDENDETL